MSQPFINKYKAKLRNFQPHKEKNHISKKKNVFNQIFNKF